MWRKIKFIQTPCYLQMRKIHSKMKVLEWTQQISHCKSMQIFYDAQEKLTPQSKQSKLNSSMLLWLSLLPARMKKIQSKMKELEWSQHYTLIFKMIKGSLLQNKNM